MVIPCNKINLNAREKKIYKILNLAQFSLRHSLNDIINLSNFEEFFTILIMYDIIDGTINENSF